ncbi:MAG: hypothetical protein AAGG01_19020 [Planctomycetota bacterium]
MTKLLVTLAPIAVLIASAAAQSSPVALQATKTPTAVRHAGVYHVSTGTWTRGLAASAGFGPDVIYSNTAPSGYFSSAGGSGGFGSGGTNYDEGIVPGSMNANNPGNRDEYQVNCVEIGYCDMGAPGTSAWEIGFYNSYAPCEGASTADSLVLIAGLPAAGGCWQMSIDLTGGGEFCLSADGGNGFDDVLELDTFGWSFRYAGTSGVEAGFLLSGDPINTDPSGAAFDGTNTYYGPPSLCSPDQATGLLTQDQWYLDDPVNNMNDGCYFFGGYRNINGCGGPARPLSSWYLELSADTGPCLGCVTSCFCLSNPNSTGANSTMTISGSLSVAANDVTLTATIPPSSFGFFLTSQTADFVANPAGSAGNLCLGGAIGRFQQLAASSGASGIISISTVAGQWSLASIPQSPGTYAAVAGGDAYFQLWHRDTSPAGPTSNFTDGVVVTWLP